VVADYRYYFGSIRTPGVIAEIPMTGTYMDQELNVGGRFDCTCHLDSTGLRNQDVIDATIPGYSFAVAERNGIVVWGGYVWSRTYQSQSKDLQLNCQSWETYPDHQLIDADLFVQGGTVRDTWLGLWNAMQASDIGRNVGINVPTRDASAFFSVTAAATEQKFFGEVMRELSDSASAGFDWYISVARVGPDYIKNLNSAVKLGEPYSDQSLIFEYPGSITNYYQIESASDAATTVFAVGAGDGSSLILGRADSNLVALAGWPRWDYVASYKDVSSAFSIQDLADQELSVRQAPKTTIKATLKGDGVPEFGSFGLGDSVRVIIKDARNPRGLVFPARIAKWTLNPPTEEDVESYGLIFVGDDNG